MRTLFFSLLILSSTTMMSQVVAETIQKEIDETVWKHFQSAFENLDAAALNATYAEEVLRVTPEGIDTEGAFKARNITSFQTSKQGGVRIALDFWFDSRHTNTKTSYEVGFYRISVTANNDTNYLYGQFHIVLQKQNGVWKITQDWDTTVINGDAIGKEDFEKKEPIQF